MSISRFESRMDDEDNRRGPEPFAEGDRVIVDGVWPPQEVVSVEWEDAVPARLDEPGCPAGWVVEIEDRLGIRDHYDPDDVELWIEEEAA